MLSSFNIMLFNVVVGIALFFVLFLLLTLVFGVAKFLREEKIKDRQEKSKKISFNDNENSQF